MKKKILIISNSTWNIFNYRINLINHLLKTSEVHIIAPDHEYKNNLINLGCKCFNFSFNPITKNLVANLFYIFKLYFMLKNINIRYDFSLTFTTKVNIIFPIILRLFSNKIIINITGLGRTFNTKSFTRTIVGVLYKLNFNLAEKIIFQTTYDMEFFRNNHNHYKFITVPGSGLNFTNNFFPTINTSRKIVFVGRLLKSKGIIDFLEIAKIMLDENNNLEFYIAGLYDKSDPDYIDYKVLENYLSNDKIVYLGFVSDIDNLLQTTDIAVLPSTYMEGIPFSLIQAAGNSNVLISYKWRGCKDIIINKKNGFLIDVDKDRLKNLKHAIEQIIKLDNKELDSMKLYSYNHAMENFSYQKVNEIYSKILK